jgi:hypothetical protein
VGFPAIWENVAAICTMNDRGALSQDLVKASSSKAHIHYQTAGMIGQDFGEKNHQS